MSDFLEHYLYKIKNKNYFKKISDSLKKIINKTEKITKNSRLKIEIEKNKFEKKKKIMELGKLVYNYFKNENIVDFSYKDDFFQINNDIGKVDSYIKNLKNGKYQDNDSK